MDISVTDVSFSVAKEVKTGSCGFCRVILNDSIAINRIRVIKTGRGFNVLLPRSEPTHQMSDGGKPIVQLLTDSVVDEVTLAVLREYHKLVKENNGHFERSSYSKTVK